MQTLEDRLTQAGDDVRRQIAKMPTRPSASLHARNRRQRVATVVAAVALLLGVAGGSLLLFADDAQTTPLSGLPILGLDLPGWISADAAEEELPEGGYRAISYYLLSEDGNHPLIVAKLRLRGIHLGSPYERDRWWMNRSDYEATTVHGHDARLFATDGDYDIVWRESAQVVVELSVLRGGQSVSRDQALAIANSIRELDESEWARLLLLRDEIPAGPTTTLGG